MTSIVSALLSLPIPLLAKWLMKEKKKPQDSSTNSPSPQSQPNPFVVSDQSPAEEASRRQMESASSNPFRVSFLQGTGIALTLVAIGISIYGSLAAASNMTLNASNQIMLTVLVSFGIDLSFIDLIRSIFQAILIHFTYKSNLFSGNMKKRLIKITDPNITSKINLGGKTNFRIENARAVVRGIPNRIEEALGTKKKRDKSLASSSRKSKSLTQLKVSKNNMNK